MDDMTRHILNLQHEQESHPERFTYYTTCESCGCKETVMTSKDEIAKYKKLHPECTGIPNITILECNKCQCKDEDDD